MDVVRCASVDIGAHDSVTIPLRSIGLHRGANNGRSTTILQSKVVAPLKDDGAPFFILFAE
jgi:hypothetical protein